MVVAVTRAFKITGVRKRGWRELVEKVGRDGMVDCESEENGGFGEKITLSISKFLGRGNPEIYNI